MKFRFVPIFLLISLVLAAGTVWAAGVTGVPNTISVQGKIAKTADGTFPPAGTVVSFIIRSSVSSGSTLQSDLMPVTLTTSGTGKNYDDKTGIFNCTLTPYKEGTTTPLPFDDSYRLHVFAGAGNNSSYGEQFLTSVPFAITTKNVYGGTGYFGGNVGIGTTLPVWSLHVMGTNPANTSGILTATDSTDKYFLTVYSGSDADPNGAAIVYSSKAPLRFGTWTVNNGTGWGEKMRIDTNGNVGIGNWQGKTVTSPLTVSGNVEISGTGNGLKFPDGTVQTTAGGGQWKTATGGINYSGGNVGIGAAAPQSSLHIIGPGDTTVVTVPYEFSLQSYESDPRWAANATRVFLKKGYTSAVANWSSTKWAPGTRVGDYLYLGSTANQSNAAQPALIMSDYMGVAIGLGTDAGTNLTDPWFSVDTNGNAKLKGTLSAAGRVGIGTANPVWPLHVMGTDPANYSGISTTTDINNKYFLTMYSGSDQDRSGAAIVYSSIAPLRFGTWTANNGTGWNETMRIDASGNVNVSGTVTAADYRKADGSSLGGMPFAGDPSVVGAQGGYIGWNNLSADGYGETDFINNHGGANDETGGFAFMDVAPGANQPKNTLMYLNQKGVLFLSTAASAGLRIQNGSGTSYWVNSPNANLMSIGGQGGVAPAYGAINIDSDARVGILTMNPGQALDVNGRARFRPGPQNWSAGFWLTDNAGTENVFTGLQGSTPTANWGVFSAGDWRLTLTNAGNLGIGTKTPSHRLQVTEPNAGAAAIMAVADATDAHFAGLYSGAPADPSPAITFPVADPLRFGAWDNHAAPKAWYERMRIDTAGNVGIGTLAPNRKLHIAGPNPMLRLENTFVWGSSSFTGLQLTADGGWQVGIGTYPQKQYWYDFSNDLGATHQLYFDGNGYDGTSNLGKWVVPNAIVAIGAAATGRGNAARLVVNTSDNNASTADPWTAIEGTGPTAGVAGHGQANGGIFTASDGTGIVARGYKNTGTADYVGVGVIASGDRIGVQGTGKSYDFYANGPSVHYGQGSSIRWKKNIRPLEHPLDKVLQLNGVRFVWDEKHGGKEDVGCVAEQVGKVLPEIVGYEPDGSGYATGMDYSKLTPLLIEAVKELKAENDALKSKIVAIEAKLAKP